MPENQAPHLQDAAPEEVKQAIDVLSRALNQIAEEEWELAAMYVCVAIGRLQSVVDRWLAENRTNADLQGGGA